MVGTTGGSSIESACSCVVVFDFDGTLAPGRGPVDAYIDAVAQATSNPDFGATAHQAVEAYEAGTSDVLDGYSAVARVANEFGVPPDVLQQAYLHSRHVLASEAGPIEVPAGLREFLLSIRPPATIVLATNAPDIRIDAALDALGVADLVDERYHSLGKPTGLTQLLTSLTPSHRVLAVGDIWHNDLMPAHELGLDTAIVGPRAWAHQGEATMWAARLVDLYAPISAWVADCC